MSRDDIVSMAREANVGLIDGHIGLIAALERFAALVAAHEREEAAKDWVHRHGFDKHGVAAAISARGNP